MDDYATEVDSQPEGGEDRGLGGHERAVAVNESVGCQRGPRDSRHELPATVESDRGDQLRPPVGLALGALYGLVAAGFYTTSNIALRYSVAVDPFLVTAVKAFPMVVMLAPFVFWLRVSGRPLATSTVMLPRFVACSFLAHFVGNACFQFSLGIIGLAAAVPITLGVLIVGGALFGKLLLEEPVSRRTMWSMVVIISAVAILSLPGAGVDLELSASPAGLWIGAMWAIGAGVCYSLFGVITRQALTSGLSIPVTMLISGSVGVCTLTPFVLLRLGWQPISEVASNQWWVMLAAGFFNFTAFVALTIALKALSVVAVNLINATQVAMAAVAAVFLFSEQMTPTIVLGILLTFVGLLILADPNAVWRRLRPA